jgi:hypothetical protein
MIRVAIVADTHGHLDPRIAELVRECDIAVHGGDIGHAGVLTALQPRSGRVHAVTGNNDLPHKWPEDQRRLLADIPALARLALPGGDLVVVHGHRLPAKGRHERLRRQHPEARAIVYGHSHRLVADRDAEPWVLNPGAAGRARTYGGPSCITLTAQARRWTLSIHRFEPAARRADRSSDHRRTRLDRAAKSQM